MRIEIQDEATPVYLKLVAEDPKDVIALQKLEDTGYGSVQELMGEVYMNVHPEDGYNG